MSRTRARVKAAVLGASLFSIALASAEFAARRRWGSPPPERAAPGSDFDYFNLQIHRDFFKKARQADGTELYVSQRDRTGGIQAFPARKEAGVFRVFVFGGSVAMGFNDHEASRLGEFLRRAAPDRRVEVVGCGMGGYDSYRESLLERELLRYRPDMLVLMSGNNEYLDFLRVDPRIYRLNLALRRSALYGKLQDAYRARQATPAPTLDDRLDNFRDNLRRMVDRARARGVPLVLCTLPANIRDVAPADGTPPPRAARRSLAVLRAYASAHPENPFVYFWLGRALERRGDPEAARDAYERALDLDDPGIRCSPRRNRIIRSFAAEPGVVVADLAGRFERLVPHGLTDVRIFKDAVHWQDEFYPLVSLSIVEALAERDRSRGWTKWWDDALAAKLSHPTVSKARRRRYAEEAVMTAVSKIFTREGLVDCAVSYLNMARRLDPAAARELVRSPRRLQAMVDANPWLERLKDGFQDGWPRVRMHAREAGLL